jgi:hypothetical protein
MYDQTRLWKVKFYQSFVPFKRIESHVPVYDEFYISPVFKRRRDTQLCIDLVSIIDVYRLVGIGCHEIFRCLAGIGGNESSHR